MSKIFCNLEIKKIFEYKQNWIIFFRVLILVVDLFL